MSSTTSNKTGSLSAARLAQLHANVATIAASRRAEPCCKNGHEFTPENTIWRKEGTRQCRTCANDRHARSEAMKRAWKHRREKDELRLEMERQRARADFWKQRALAAEQWRAA